MIDKLLASCLEPVVAAEKRWRQRRFAAWLFLVGALGFVALAALAHGMGWWSPYAAAAWAGLLMVASLAGWRRIEGRLPDLRAPAGRVEQSHPDLRMALLAAMDQKPQADGSLSFLQRKLLGEVSDHAVRNHWVRQVSQKQLTRSAWGVGAASLAFALSVWLVLSMPPPPQADLAQTSRSTSVETPAPTAEVRVAPGDVELEKGASLLVEATFSGAPSGPVTLVHRHDGGESRYEMRAGLDEAIFSQQIPKIGTDGSYQIVFGSQETGHSAQHAIRVYELPELRRVDATVTPPDYTGGEEETIVDTRKITVMEGADVAWRLHINKPVSAAELYGKDDEIIPLQPDPDDPLVLVAAHEATETGKYRVHLVDAEGRANERPPWLSVTVRKNTPPRLKLTFPGRDGEVSALQEMALEAEVSDDVGVLRAGMGYQFRGKETEVVLVDQALPSGKKHPLLTTIDLESLGAVERELITYYFWAEDEDRTGAVRRSASDRFFAEVRLFDDVVREGTPGEGEPSSESGGEAGELLRIQKEIINATWTLLRAQQAGDKSKLSPESIGVVAASQRVVIAQTSEALERVEDAQITEALTSAMAHMTQAASHLEASADESKDSTSTLPPALDSATAAYQDLLRAKARETAISQSRSQSSSAQQSGQERQRNLNLELKQKDLKYEETTTANPQPQSAEQKENLAILDRLRELARRQEAILDKIRDLEKQLQTVEGKEKEEAQRQLKRLQEEQRRQLQESDDLAERMDAAENRADLAADLEALRQAREALRDTAEKLESEQLADAANSATRASSQLDEMKEEFRKKTSQQFSDEVRSLRDSARSLAERQQSLSEQADKLIENERQALTDTARREAEDLSRALLDQVQKTAEMMESMRTLSEQAEASEPLLSNALYEAVREAASKEIAEDLSEGARMAQRGLGEPTKALAENASRNMDALKDRVEKAAEKLLGNESDALRSARETLDQLIDASKSEADKLAQNETPTRSDTSDGAATPAASAASATPPAPSTTPRFFEEAHEQRSPGPIVGEDYEDWADRIADLGAMLSQEDLRNSVARIRDEARDMRIRYRRGGSVPTADTVRMKIVTPLLELRQRVGEELAKMNRDNPLAPIDRDPVPGEFRDLVRRYYQELGTGQ